MSNILVAVRTHVWDNDTKKLAYKLYSEVPNCDFVILFDETNGSYDTSPFEKVSHTGDMSDLNLPAWPRNVLNLHYNGDYALYSLRHQKPNYDFYFMLENDATVNIDIENIIKQCVEDEIDFLGQIDQINDPKQKEFYLNIITWLPSYARAFFPLIGMSGRLIDMLYNTRITLSQKEDTKEKGWPYCEAYVGSFVVSNPDIKFLNLKDIANTKEFEWRNHKHILDPRVYKKGTVIHPITSVKFIEKNLMHNTIDAIFNEKSTLFTGVQCEDPKDFLPILEKKIKERKNPTLLAQFWSFALAKGWINVLPAINIAFAKPATQSSIHPTVSRFKTVEEDAALLVDGILDTGTKSHTNHEEEPWVMIDLVDTFEIRSILLYVRPAYFHNFLDFRIDISLDKENWKTIYSKSDGVLPDSANMKPIIINIGRKQKTRYVKIIQETPGCLHLNQVEIYSY